MSTPQLPYAAANSYARQTPTFIPRGPAYRKAGDAAVAPGGYGGLGALIGGLAAPLLCLGCLATLAILGLFATMIGAAAYMNGIQNQYSKNLQGAGSTIELNFAALFCALLCSIYMLAKHRSGVAISS